MRGNMNKDIFEQLIKSSAEEYRMYPSDKVWKSIHKEMHVYRRWRIAGLVTMLVSIGVAVTWVMNSYHLPNENISQNPQIKPVILQNIVPVSSKKVFTLNKIAGTEKINAEVPTSRFVPALGTSIQNQVFIYAGQQIENSNKSLIIREQAMDIPALTPTKEWEPQITNNTPIHTEPTIREKELSTGIAEDKVAIDEAHKPLLQVIKPTNAYEDAKAFTHANHYLIPGIESVSNGYKAPPKELKWQFYFSTGISYRSLSNNKSYALSLAPTPYTGNINEAVKHRPDIGFQAGLATKYPISKHVNVKGGLQFNVNKYDVSAYEMSRQEKATIELADGKVDSKVDTWTSLRNYGAGYKWVKNYYSSISAPIGAEVILGNSNKTKWGVAATIQPTFLIGDRVYMLSTDFKNYTKVDWLVRRVNVASGAEVFVVLSNKKTTYQIGPQVRYNLLSSFQSKYPIAENIYDAGIKVGISLNH